MKDVLKKGLVRRFLASLLQPTQRHYSSGSEADELVNRIQILQSAYEMSLPANQPYIVRLDGVAFRNYTVGMQKPFDSRLTRAILLTTRDLLERCSARMAFCQSDEISLLFPPESTPLQIIYAGRVQKIVSVMASLAAARFNWHIGRMSWQDVDDSVRERILSSSATFDARIFSTPSDMMAADAIYWRHALDGRRNSVNMIGCQYYSSKTMHGMPLGVLIERLRKDHNIDPFKSFPPTAMYGAFLKKKTVPHVGFNPKTGQSVPTLRARIEARSFDWTMSGVERAQMVMAKMWEEGHPASLEIIELD